jgi:hypothetical protein
LIVDELEAFPLTKALLDLVEAHTDPALISRVQILMVLTALDHEGWLCRPVELEADCHD